MKGTARVSVLMLALALGCGCSSGGRQPDQPPVNLTWTPSVEATDETAVTDLIGYRLEWRSSGRSGDFVRLNLPPTQTAFQLALPGGSWEVSLIAISASRGESDRSNELKINR